MRKNVLLTIWLLLPLIVVGGLCWWIVVVFAKGPPEKLPPVGAGAGDAGGANAIGQWFRDDDSAQVDPRAWPGGIELSFPASAVRAGEDDASAFVFTGPPPAHTSRAWRPHRRGDRYVLTLANADVRSCVGLFVAGSSAVSANIVEGELVATDGAGRKLAQLLPARVDPRDTAAADPLRIDLGITSVYADEQSP